MKIGFLTIGQSPRHDILEEILPQLSDLKVIEAGALDGLSADQIASLRPGEGEETLVSRLRDGKQVVMGKKKLHPLLNEAINRLHNAGAEISILLCTGTFELTSAPIPLIQPGRIMRNLIGSILSKEGKLGLIVPLEDQKKQIEDVWKEFVDDIKILTLSPYMGLRPGPEWFKALSDRDLVVMDCMGYRLEHERLVRMYTKRPVFLPKRLISSLVKEFYQL
ncbi:MAG: hypothetical protein DRO00_04890 [Thermoproteota archaeon]|nr:MAG: hypothetical protein DRO00_04890 [Candidatus Korarchaeota archaeon]